MQKSPHYLRILWTVSCGLACVLLIALWVRSYWWCDIVYYRKASRALFLVRSDQGAVSYGNWSVRLGTMQDLPAVGWTRRQWPHREGTKVASYPLFNRVFRWFDRTVFGHEIPNWFLLLLVGAAVGVPWIPWSPHFSLRTLLIATTLIAAVLGFAVYAMRQ